MRTGRGNQKRNGLRLSMKFCKADGELQIQVVILTLSHWFHIVIWYSVIIKNINYSCFKSLSRPRDAQRKCICTWNRQRLRVNDIGTTHRVSWVVLAVSKLVSSFAHKTRSSHSSFRRRINTSITAYSLYSDRGEVNKSELCNTADKLP